MKILKKFKHFNNDLFSDEIKIEIIGDGTREEIK